MTYHNHDQDWWYALLMSDCRISMGLMFVELYMLHTSCPHWTRGHLSSSGALNSVNSLIISQYHRTVLTYLDIGIYKIQRFSLWNGCFYDYSHFFPHERSSWSHLHRSLPWAYPFFSDSGMATMGWLPWPMALKFPRRISTSSISSCRRKTSPLWKRLPKKHWRPKEKKRCWRHCCPSCGFPNNGEYPLINVYITIWKDPSKSSFSMGKSTINSHVQ